VQRSHIDGKGLFAGTPLRSRRKLGELTGEVIGQREARRRARTRRRITIIELDDGTAVDGRKGGNELWYTNHSCGPNAFIRVCYGRIELWSLRDIAAGEEITCDYGDTQHDGKLRCRCGGESCRGYL
jgi:SET domain-containing protein